MQIISKFATIAIPRKCDAGGNRAIVAAEGHKPLIVKEMLNCEIAYLRRVGCTKNKGCSIYGTALFAKKQQ